MNVTRRALLVCATAGLASTWAGAGLAASSTVRVGLWDRGATSMNMLGQGPMMGMGMGQGAHHGPMGPMGVKLSTSTVPAGRVTFRVLNQSKALIHEMVISPVKDTNAPLPYDQAGNKVDEDAAGHLGEVAELEPGRSGVLTLDLKPGTYILYCNVAGHYALGMWALLSVKG